ncbi:MAG: hypothetical protein IKE31_08665 [Eubacterium sp.]|nr:hypothetical protein [Eubacterium sp.]MBR3361186.1 hypothetical protein [Lachnospiraceae bacterium]
MKPRKPLTETHPELCEEWSERNFPFGPESEHMRSPDKVWWKGKCGHEWYAQVRNRASKSRPSGCPYCGKHSVLPGFNDFASAYPEIAAEWSEKNLPLTPDRVARSSSLKVWWKGKCGHEWQTQVSNRARGNGCPICSKEPVVPGTNDLKALMPELAAQWSEKNEGLKPEKVRLSYPKPVWWTCPVCGNDYSCQIQTRQAKYKQCPYCSGKKVREGFNDLATTDPLLAAEWDPEANGSITPETVNRTWKKSAVWKCSTCGHSWHGQIRDRAEGKTSCPYCAGQVQKEESRKTPAEETFPEYAPKKTRPNAVEIPVWERPYLTVAQASLYYGISIIKLRKIINADRTAAYLTWKNGGNVHIDREKFERYLEGRLYLFEEKEDSQENGRYGHR